MFGGLFGSLIGKIAALVISITGLTGGLVATGSLPMLDQSDGTLGGSGVQTRNTAGAGVPLSFPDIPTAQELVEAGGSQDMAIASAGQAIQAAGTAEATARQAAEAARRCIEQVTASVSALVAKVSAATTPEEAQALVTQAKGIAESAHNCVKQATALGKSGVDQANQARAQAEAAARQLDGVNLTGATQGVVSAAESAAGTATGTAGEANDTALGAFQKVADLSMDLMRMATEMQKSFEASQGNPGTVPLPVPAPTTPQVPNPAQFSAQWERFGMDMATRAMNDWSKEGFSRSWYTGKR